MNTTHPFCAVIASPFGAIGLRTEDDALTHIVYLPKGTPLQVPCNRLAAQAVKQLQHYFQHADYVFNLPLRRTGSTFQNKVWQAIAAIPVGQTQTYGALAKQIGSAARAVGQACGNNHLPLLIPCHRVVAAQGLGGFMRSSTAHDTLQIKSWLLRHEGAKKDIQIEPF